MTASCSRSANGQDESREQRSMGTNKSEERQFEVCELES